MQIEPNRLKPFEPLYYVAEDRVDRGRHIRLDPISPYFSTRAEAEAAQAGLIECGHQDCYIIEGKLLADNTYFATPARAT